MAKVRTRDLPIIQEAVTPKLTRYLEDLCVEIFGETVEEETGAMVARVGNSAYHAEDFDYSPSKTRIHLPETRNLPSEIRYKMYTALKKRDIHGYVRAIVREEEKIYGLQAA
ncbi:hypothetical protein HN747_04425 [archaeon]|jgi:hypothetical protein|nr:hypothetical protein [archaeon]